MSTEDRSDISLGEAEIVQIGDYNTVKKYATNIIERRYKGEYAELRTAIDHDLTTLERMPPGAARDEFARQLMDRALHLSKKSKKEFFPRWARRTFATAIVGVVVLVVFVLCFPIASRHGVIAKGHPEYSSEDQWRLAVTSFLRRKPLSPRGNPLLRLNEVVGVSGPKNPSPPIADDMTDYNISLVRVSAVETCDIGAADAVPRPMNGSLLLLNFQITGQKGAISDANALLKRNFFSGGVDGPVRDIGGISGVGCIAGIVNDGVQTIAPSQIIDVKILADVPDGHGYIGYRWAGNESWEWSY